MSSALCFFFSNQKTAYEITRGLEFRRVLFRSRADGDGRVRGAGAGGSPERRPPPPRRGGDPPRHGARRYAHPPEIGRASCRESVDLGGRRIIKKKKKVE